MKFLKKLVEKRQFARLKANCLVKYEKSEDLKSQAAKMSNIRDISKGGLMITTHEKLLPGDTLKLKIHWPGPKKAIVAEAKVLRCRRVYGTRHYRVGVFFLKISDEDRKEIDSHIDLVAKKK